MRLQEEPLLQFLKLPLEAFHLLAIHLHLFIGVAQNETDIPGDGAEVKHFAAAVERGCGVSDPLTLSVILVANLNREGRIDNETVSLAHLDLRIDRNRHCSAEVDDDVSVHRLEIAIGRILRRRHEPCGDAASGRRCLDVVVRLGNVDAAVGRLQIGRARAARDAYATALCFGANETGGLADLNLASGGFGNKISAGALESNVAAIGDKMRRAAD